jgi:hypothetical protein
MGRLPGCDLDESELLFGGFAQQKHGSVKKGIVDGSSKSASSGVLSTPDAIAGIPHT